MNRNLASILSVTTTTAAAILAVSLMAAGNAYADDITIDTTPFVSSKTRAEVRGEVMGQSEALRIASSEWAMNQAARPHSDYTSAQAKAEFLASRNEVRALTAEDSGSSYLASLPRRMNAGVNVAGSTN